MSSLQQAIDCPNPWCATPAALALCTRFAYGFGLQLDSDGAHSARWDDTHCLVCGHFSSPYATSRQQGQDLRADMRWLAAVDRALRQAKRSHLTAYLAEQELGVLDLLAMRQATAGLRLFEQATPDTRAFPQVGLLRIAAEVEVPDTFGISHGEAESEPFTRKVQVLARLLGADAAESTPRHCAVRERQTSWFFYQQDAFIGLLSLGPNRSYRGTMTIDGCLQRLLRAS